MGKLLKLAVLGMFSLMLACSSKGGDSAVSQSKAGDPIVGGLEDGKTGSWENWLQVTNKTMFKKFLNSVSRCDWNGKKCSGGNHLYLRVDLKGGSSPIRARVFVADAYQYVYVREGIAYTTPDGLEVRDSHVPYSSAAGAEPTQTYMPNYLNNNLSVQLSEVESTTGALSAKVFFRGVEIGSGQIWSRTN